MPKAPEPPRASGSGGEGIPQRPTRGAGCAWLLGGVILVLAGVPMLVLPGPGLAAIFGGFWMIGRGLGIVPRRR